MNQIYERKGELHLLAVHDRPNVFLSTTLFITQYNVYIERLPVILKNRMSNKLYKQYNGFFKWKKFAEDCEEMNTDLTLLRSSPVAEQVFVHSNWCRLIH